MIGIKHNEDQDEQKQDALSDVPLPVENDEWFSESGYDGQLAVDVYQTADTIVIKSPIAGVAAEDIDIAVNGDVVTIRGRRQQGEKIADKDYLFQECYWGGFSRSIILPADVQTEKVVAEMKNGVLTVRMPKARSQSVRVIPVRSRDE